MLPDDDDDDDDMLEDGEESSDLEHDPAIAALFPDDEDCDMCGITGVELMNFSDCNGIGCVCIDCYENRTSNPPQDAAPAEHAAHAELDEPETEPDIEEPSSDPDPEPDEFASNDAKRRRLNE